MPAYKKPKYSIELTQEITMRAFAALSESNTPLTIDEIKQADLFLINITDQKISRVLSELCEKGFIKKTKSKSKNKMIYMSIEVLKDQGYDTERMVC